MASEDDIAFEAIIKATESKADTMATESKADALKRRHLDQYGIYETAMRGLEKNQDELGRMGMDRNPDNPYYIELLNQYPDFYDWEKKLGGYNVGYQKHGMLPRMLHKGYDDDRYKQRMKKFEEAKKDTSYYKQSIMDSLVQAYGFDKLNKRKKK